MFNILRSALRLAVAGIAFILISSFVMTSIKILFRIESELWIQDEFWGDALLACLLTIIISVTILALNGEFDKDRR